MFFIALKLCYNKLVTTKYIKDISESPIKILHQAVENIKPSVEKRKVRIAASTVAKLGPPGLLTYKD